MSKDKIKGYKLLIEYPGCSKGVGYFEPYTSGAFLNYPKIWEPVYTKKHIRSTIINKILDGDKDKI